MAIDIKSIPILYNKAAEDFQKTIDENSANRSSIDFSKESSIAQKIMAKSKL